MPHCVIECPQDLKTSVDFDILVKVVHDSAELTGLFSIGDVKARVIPFHNDIVGGLKQPYVHVCVSLLSGRTDLDKLRLSELIARSLCNLLPDVYFISVEARDIPRGTYVSRASLGHKND